MNRKERDRIETESKWTRWNKSETVAIFNFANPPEAAVELHNIYSALLPFNYYAYVRFFGGMAEGLEARQTKCSRKGTDIKPPTAMILSGIFVVWSNDLSATVIAQNKSQWGYKWTEVGTFFFFSLYFPLQLLVANCNVKRQARQSTRSCGWSGGTTASSFPFQIRKVAQELNSNLYLQRMDG